MSQTAHAGIAAVSPARVQVRRIRDDDDFAAVVELRRRVFGDEQGIADSDCSDVDDARSILALALLGDLPVGTGRLTLNAGHEGEAQITWVATLPAYRGRGVGSAVMRFLLAAADVAGAPFVVLSAQTHALAFYRRLGFVPYGNRFLAVGIEHQMMARPRSIPIAWRSRSQ